MVQLFSEIIQELHQTTVLVVIDVFDDSLHTALLTCTAFFIDRARNLDLFIFQSWRHIDDSRLLTRWNIMQHMEAGEEQQLFIESIPIETRDVHNLLF